MSTGILVFKGRVLSDSDQTASSDMIPTDHYAILIEENMVNKVSTENKKKVKNLKYTIAYARKGDKQVTVEQGAKQSVSFHYVHLSATVF